jgi:hypothetical protein
MWFALERHELFGFTDNFGGTPITVVAAPCNVQTPVTNRPKPAGSNQQIALDVIRTLLRDSTDCGKAGAPALRPCVDWSAAVEAVAGRLPVDGKRQRERAIEAIKGLVAKKIIEFAGDWLWCQ